MLNDIRDYIKSDGNVKENNGITLSVVLNTEGITRKVIVTIAAISEDGIKSLTSTAGINKTYSSGTKEILETCEITENGIYIFTVENEKGQKSSRGILIDNILDGIIKMVPDKTIITKDNVQLTITWPEGSEKGTKEIKVGNNAWQSASSNTSVIEVTENCVVRARLSNSSEEVVQGSITISNIDKNHPIVTASPGIEEIKNGDSINLNRYFTVNQNGIAPIEKIAYTDTSNGNKEITNVNTLSAGTHVIKCTAIKTTGLSASATKTIVVEKGVYANLYKINDIEYHLIFNSTGNIAQGYTQEQLVCGSEDISNGRAYTAPWKEYLGDIKRVIIEEEISPKSTELYFQGLSSINTIENLENLKTDNVTSMYRMFYECSSLTSLDLQHFNTSNVENMHGMFSCCEKLQTVNISSFDTSRVINMELCFNLVKA